MIAGLTYYEFAAYFLIYSFLGWCVEVTYAAVADGILSNRGFLNGPVCPIYGFGMLILLIFLAPIQENLLLLFLGGVIIPSLLELVGGWALYKLYHTRWWDYSDFPFNFGGYICLMFSLLWGIGTVLIIRVVHPLIARLVAAFPTSVGWVLMVILYVIYAIDLVLTAISAAGLSRELDTLEKVADSIHAVSDAMTELIGTSALDADQKLDEGRLQMKLAAAEMRTAAENRSPRDIVNAARDKADEAMEAARRASELQRLNATEAASAARLAAIGTAERAGELLKLEQLKAELEARSDEMQAQLLRHPHFGPGRLLRAYPKLRHGSRMLSMDALRERLQVRRNDTPAESPQNDSNNNGRAAG